MADIGIRIMERRQQLGWTQSDLAFRMGYKTKSAINKIELGINDISQTKVRKFAEVLGVSVAYLMGQEKTEQDQTPTQTIGERIKARREELQLSQDELAKRLGYKSRSSINKIETDSRNLTQSKIKPIADALDTTPAYIMGWGEDAEIGEKIRAARLAKGMTQGELGEILGVQKSAVAKYENGRVVNIKRSTLKKLSEVLGIALMELIDEDLSTLLDYFQRLGVEEKRAAIDFVRSLADAKKTEA